MSRPRVFVAGWSGAGNLGDELLLQALQHRLSRYDAELVVASADPAATRRLHDVEAIGSFDVVATRRVLRSADAMVFGPGGIIQDQTSAFSIPAHLWRVALARRIGVPIIGVGLGAVPLQWKVSKTMVRRTLGGLSLVMRDGESAAVVADCGITDVQVTADLVFGLEHAAPVLDRIVVAPRPFSPGRLLPSGVRERSREDPRVGPLASAIDAMAGAFGLPVHLVAFQPERDRSFVENVAARLSCRVSIAEPTLDDVAAEVGSGRVVVAMRYHAAVTAVACGRPAVLIGYSPKVSSLAQHGGEGVALLPDDPDEYARIGDLAEAVSGHERQVAAAGDALRERERTNVAILDEFFSRIRPA